MMKGRTLRAIGSIAVLGTLAGFVAAQSWTLSSVKGDIEKAPADWKIVIGADAKPIDVLGAVEVGAALQYLNKATVSEGGKAVFEKTTSEIEGAVPLYKDTNKLYLDDSLNKAVKIVSDGLVFGTKTFKDKDDNEYTYTLDAEIGTAKIVYDDKPDTDAKDPTLMVKAVYEGEPVYTLRVLFTSPVPTDKVSSQEIELFGKKFYFKSIDSASKVWKLYEAATEKTLKSGESIEFDGKTVKLVGISKEIDSSGNEVWGAVIDVDGTQEKLEEGQNKEINGVYVTVQDVYELNNEGYAKLLLGGQEVTFDANTGVAKIGDTEIRNVKVLKADDTGLELAVYVSDDNNKNYIEAGKDFVDPIFGTFKVVFSPVDLKAGKYEIKVVDTGDKTADLVVKDFRGYEKSISSFIKVDDSDNINILDGKYKGSIYAAGLGATSATVTSTNSASPDTIYVYGEDGQIHTVSLYKDTTNDLVYVSIDGNTATSYSDGDTFSVGNVQFTVHYDTSDDSASVSTTDKVIYTDNPGIVSVTYDNYIAVKVSDTERYLLRIRSVDVTNKEVEFEDVFSGNTYKATYDTNGYGKLILGGSEFYFHVYDEANRAIAFLGKETDDTELKLAIDGDSVLDIVVNNAAADPTVTFKLYDDVDGDTTNGAEKALVKSVITYDTSNKKLEISTSSDVTTLDSANNPISVETASDDNDYKALDKYGDYVEFKTGDDYYLRIYYPDEQVSYDVELAPTEATTKTETKTLEVGDELEGWKLVKIEGAQSEEVKPLGTIAYLDTDAAVASADKLIVIGGPAVNRKAAEFLGVSYPTYGADLVAKGLIAENSAIIKVVENAGRVAVLIYGWEGEDTLRASRVFADYLKGLRTDIPADAEAIEVPRNEAIKVFGASQ